MQDALAIAEQRLAAGELRPALDALKEARAQAYEAGDREQLERIRTLALQMQPHLGEGSRADRSCTILLVAVQESLHLLPEDSLPRETPESESESESESEPEPEIEIEIEDEPEPGSDPEPAPEPTEPEPFVSEGVSPGHIEEAWTSVLEPGERLLGMFLGVVRETREDGGRGAVISDDAVNDYLLVSDRGVVLWARGRSGTAEGYRFAEITDAETVRNVFSRSIVVEVGETRRWFSSMRRDDADFAGELIRELAGLQR